MAKLTILGRDFEIAPYKLGAMIEAAPFIDAQKARQATIEARAGVTMLATDTESERSQKLNAIVTAGTMAEMMQNLADAVRILHVGVARIDPTVSVEAMIDDIDPTPGAMLDLMQVMNAVLRGSGMEKGEAPAPAAAEAAGASETA